MDILRDIGLTKYESLVYESLLKHGKNNAKDISKYSSVPPMAVYPNLDSLISFGLVQKFDGDPDLFEVISPKKALKSFFERKKKELEENESKVIDFTDSLVNEKVGLEKKKVFDISYGREFSNQVYYEAFETAKDTIYILGWRFEKVKDKYNFLNRIKKAVRRGVDVRIITIGDKSKKNIELVNAYKEAGIKVRYFYTDNFSILLVDSKSCKFTLKKKGESKTNINILDESLTDAMKKYYLDCWDKSEDLF